MLPLFLHPAIISDPFLLFQPPSPSVDASHWPLDALIKDPHSARHCQARPSSLLPEGLAITQKARRPRDTLLTPPPHSGIAPVSSQASRPASELICCWDRKACYPCMKVYQPEWGKPGPEEPGELTWRDSGHPKSPERESSNNRCNVLLSST